MRSMRHRSNKLICGIDGTPFVPVFSAVALVLLVIFMLDPPHIRQRSTSVDMAKVGHPVSMRAADREDAIVVAVELDGKVFFRGDPVRTDQLPGKIREALSQGAERKVYIKADARVFYGTVKEALEGVRSSGVEKVGLLVDERQAPSTAA